MTSSIQKWLEKGPKLVSDRLMVIERRKIKSKKNFEVRYLLMKQFFQNFDILALCCDFIISKMGQKYSNLHIIHNWWKNVKIKNCNNFGSKIFFWRRNFWILKLRSLLWRHYSKTGSIRAELTSEMRFSTSWYCRRKWQPYRRVTFNDICFHRTPLVAHINTQAYYSRPGLSNFDKKFESRGAQTQWLTCFI